MPKHCNNTHHPIRQSYIRHARVALTTLALLLSAPAPAIVNVESMRGDDTPEGYSGKIEAAVSGQSGYTDKTGVDVGARVQWQRDRITNFGILRYAYGESSGVRDTNKSFAHLRHIHQVTERRAYEAYLQGESNEFARLSFRGLVGAGLRYTLAEIPKVRATHVGVGAYYARETLDDEPGLSDDGSEDFWRFSTYLNYQRQVNELVQLLSTTYYQPRVNDFGDYRLLEEAALKVKMSANLALKLSVDVVHDSKPPQSVKETDISYRSGIEYNF